MSDTSHGAHGADPHAPSAADAHGTGHAGGHDEHGHPADTLGPIDWQMWAVGVLSVAVALLMTAGFVLATSFRFNA